MQLDFVKKHVPNIPGLGIVLVICILMLIGVLASNLIGKKFLNLVETLTKKIPLVGAVYKAGKQFSQTLALTETANIKRIVFVEYPQTKFKVIGFVTGSFIDLNNPGELLYRVFVPTVPNPTSGFVFFLKASQMTDPNWTMEDTLKILVSGGMIGPESVQEKAVTHEMLQSPKQVPTDLADSTRE
jgi:uncharacterized membrane protein